MVENMTQPGAVPSSVPREALPVRERAGRRAVRDDRCDVVALAGDVDQRVGAGRQPDGSDPAGIDVVGRSRREARTPEMSFDQSQP